MVFENVQIDRTLAETWINDNTLEIDGSLLNSVALSALSLQQAPEDTIHIEITAVYDEADKENEKPPNLNEITNPVQDKLRKQGLDASANHIRNLAGDKRHKGRRRKPGATVASEKKRGKRG